MGTTRWASGSVAGVALVEGGSRDLRVDVEGGEPFKEAFVGNAQESLDLTVHVQLLARNLRGVHFGIKAAQMPTSVWDALVAAIEAAVGAGLTFPVILSDAGGADDISVEVVPDWAANGGALLKRGPIAAGFAKEVTMKFISTGGTT